MNQTNDIGDLGFRVGDKDAESDRIHPLILAIKRRQKMRDTDWQKKSEGGPNSASGAIPE